ncbi:zinc finger CCCH domain-containing protein 32-like [Impatiens glandulifera]|uniref:zinc finger CCCH domain-containing protein 32-like n=1 Tax=Impatiens glandulifera TaxID=253017 RepID=UPI001FB18A64|nr:zinc finger CCCH domain-containing protein 32-like [Impatiens glandulifera]
MDLYGRREGSGLVAPPTGTPLQDSMWKLGLWNAQSMYPERPGAPDCSYYMRTGSCGYGAKCRYNHPPDRNSVGGALTVGGVVGEYPERPGELACQFYLRTGFCKFGASCKFHHPKTGGFVTNMRLSSYGFPLRPGEQECSYYLRTGQCKFGITCKFNHPQPAGVSVPASTARPFYPAVQSSSSSALSADQYGGATSSFRAARPPLLPGSYVPSAYGTTTMLLPTGVVSIPGWNPYSGPVSPVLSPSAQPSVGAGSVYGVTQISSSSSGFPGIYPSVPSPADASNSSHKEKVFPERLGQPDCQYYLQTGDCKFGPSCRYHHPPDWAISKMNCALNYLGLPLRPGVQACTFYMQRGSCKFGKICKFDHPVGSVRYSPSTSSLSDIPVTPYMATAAAGGGAAISGSFSYPELRPEFISASKLEPALS